MSAGDSQNLPHYDIIRTYVLYGSEVNVMIVYKAYKFRIYPNKKQMELINKTIGCSRFVFNFFLTKITEGYFGVRRNLPLQTDRKVVKR
ncbi:transposase [Bacillus methanolicus]|uniref:helix-turn-helix domain-containing protein n=1 Tax=Bacillus methanolicus TaxID=1471 RepID=UPI0020108B8C|nr:helix-turn-helix domain-containing protein [Bacillus methanolicus]UQD53247.1 transposase [Bacillus methanolicus]